MNNEHATQEPVKLVKMSPKVRFYRYLALSCHIGLLAWISIWYFLLIADQEYSLTFIILMYLVPLLLPLRGIILALPYTHAWSCFIILWYFMHAITIIYAEPEYMLHAIFELILASGMFVGCCMFARLRGQELGTGLPKLSKVMEIEKASFEGTQKNE